MASMSGLCLSLLLSICNCLIFLSSVCEAIDGGRAVRLDLNKITSSQSGRPSTSYYATIRVGTPPKSVKVLPDVNSRENWVPHTNSLLGELGTLKRLHYKGGYLARESSTSVQHAQGMKYDYLGCELSGNQVQDVLEFTDSGFQGEEGTESINVSIEQNFLGVWSASDDRFANLSFDGVIGLPPIPKLDSGAPTVLSNLKQANLIDNLKFSIWIANEEAEQSNDDPAYGGEVLFGDLDESRLEGEINYHPLMIPYDRWELRIHSVMLGGEVVSSPRGSVAIFTLTLSELHGPADSVERILGQLKVNKTETDEKKVEDLNEIDCSKRFDANFPVLTFNIGGKMYHVGSSDYIKYKNSGACYVAIIPSPSAFHWYLGTDFLKNYYTTFDLTNRQIGIATAKRD